MTKAVESGMPKLRIEEAAARRQARVDRGEDVIVGVNKYRLENEAPIDTRSIDNTEVRRQQLVRLERLKATRDPKRVQAALDALTEGAKGDGNLLALSIEATRRGRRSARSPTRSKTVFGRYRANIRTISGVYGGAYADDEEFQRIRKEVEAFATDEGRRPRILVAKLGQDGHDRGAKVIATAFADLGFDVDIGPLFQTPEEAAREAIENDVHVVGISSQAAGHKTLVPQLIEALRAQGANEIVVVVGGSHPRLRLRCSSTRGRGGVRARNQRRLGRCRPPDVLDADPAQSRRARTGRVWPGLRVRPTAADELAGDRRSCSPVASHASRSRTRRASITGAGVARSGLG